MDMAGQLATEDPKLRAGALRLPSVLMQAVGHIGPTAGVVTSLVFITTVAGIVSPIAFVFGGVICLGVAICLAELAKHIGGAGGYFHYVSRTVGPRAGFFTAWIYFLYDPLVYGVLITWFAGIFEQTMKAQYGWGPPWWLTFVVGIALLTFLMARGIELSSRFIVLFGIGEIVILFALAFSGLASPGKGGVNFSPFNPGNSPSVNALYLGVVFSILTFTGFESVAPLAEETANPRRNLPRAMILSVVFMSLVYVVACWGILVGWGTGSLASFTASPDPIFQLARHLWGGAWILVMFAVFNSSFACATACGNAATRVFFAMGRTGVLPAGLGRVHPRFKTPTNAIYLQGIFAIVWGLLISIWIGPQNSFYFVGIVLTLGLIFVYSAGNLGTFLLYWREHRPNFNWFLHAILPLATSLALIWVGWKSIEGLHITSPQNYLDWTPAVVGGWVVVGLGVLVYVSRSRKQDWLGRAGQSVGEFEVGLHPAIVASEAMPDDLSP
jgi:amino acid transporter